MIKEMSLFRLLQKGDHSLIKVLKEEGENLGFTEVGKQESWGRMDSEFYGIGEEGGGLSFFGI